jgi:hypothetical protein
VNPDRHRFHFNVTYYKEVLGVQKSIRASKAAGLDNIPPKLVKDAAEELATPLTTLVNRSLTCGLFPTAEKAAKISPIYKSEDKTALDNYRPISVLPVFSKVLERVVYNRLSYSTTSRKTNFLVIPSMDFIKSGQPSTPRQSSWMTLEQVWTTNN